MNILLVFVLAVVNAWKPTSCGVGNQITEWGKNVDPSILLPEYPRPQMVRQSTWKNLNGLWEYEAATTSSDPPFGRKLTGEILVPFPVEACLSGVGESHERLWYRVVFDAPSTNTSLLHFGAVDWNTTVWFNGHMVTQHVGGYDGFSVDVTPFILDSANELIVFVYDPSEKGHQPNGKQSISRILDPGGDTYTPASGIWQTVWLEDAPATYIQDLHIDQDMASVTVTVHASASSTVDLEVMDGKTSVAKASGNTGHPIRVVVPSPKLWAPGSPFLYDLKVTLASGDSVTSYFGLREFTIGSTHTPGTGPQEGIDRSGGDLPGFPKTLPSANPDLCWKMCNDTAACVAWAYGIPHCDHYTVPQCWLKGSASGTSHNKCRVSGVEGRNISTPRLNGQEIFLAGWLDQSFWPDGIYTAPSDEALAFDLLSLDTFGLNMVRLHQKVNSERWYYHADRLGVIVFQDMPQKYGGATPETVAPFMKDLDAMIKGRRNHPSIVQWTAFNEGDCVSQFDAASVVRHIQKLDPTRLVDTNSGGKANDLHVGDVNDVHNYPYPSTPSASATQYAMQGEFGGIGAFIKGKEWVPGKCHTYMKVDTPQEEADTYIAMTKQLTNIDTRASVYTQIADVELECDGFLNYDRTNKFNDAQTQAIAKANRDLIASVH